MTNSELIRILQALPPNAPVTAIESISGTETVLSAWAIRVYEGRVVLDAEGVTQYPHYKQAVMNG